MQVIGNIATVIERRVGNASGKPFFTFRLAENNGRDENRTTTWYDVTAFISELDADLLAKGQFIKVTGRLEVKAFKRRDETLDASATILAYGIEPVERKAAPAGAPAGTPEGAAPRAQAPVQAHAPTPARAPVQAQAPTPRPASGFDDMDDDIPF
jgi:single-strand DNA-binding protein